MKSTWNIEEMSYQSGLPIEVLHEYDELGLLEGSISASNMHKEYSDEAVKHVQQIAALRSLGFSQGEIKFIMESGDFVLPDDQPVLTNEGSQN